MLVGTDLLLLSFLMSMPNHRKTFLQCDPSRSSVDQVCVFSLLHLRRKQRQKVRNQVMLKD